MNPDLNVIVTNPHPILVHVDSPPPAADPDALPPGVFVIGARFYEVPGLAHAGPGPHVARLDELRGNWGHFVAEAGGASGWFHIPSVGPWRSA